MKKRLLAVVAHPDDETFGMGGTLAYYAHMGVEVHLICATRGEAGEVDPEKLEGFGSIGDLREHELRCAAEELGLKKIHFLDFRDSGMPDTIENQHPNALIQAPIDVIAKKIRLLILDIKPYVVLTFDPVGGYMHPDHIMIHNATIRAFFQARVKYRKEQGLESYRPEKMFLHIFPRTYLRIFVKLFPLLGKDPKKFGKNGDIDLTAILRNNFPVHVKINYKKVANIREKASACHASQGGDNQSGYIISWLLRHISSNEFFMQAYPAVKNNLTARDLFAV